MALQDREMMAKDCEGMMNLAEKGKRRRAGWKRRSSAEGMAGRADEV